jgi:ABC-type nitrate/sulfonate/bicarbonate transport system ATPase subunit
MVFQEYALFPWLTVADNILFGDRVRKKPQAERATILQHYLELVHLEGYGKYFPAQLSGGMKQRVALARAWANAPDVLLLDEPFGALDALSRRELQDELLRIWQAERRTCVFVTHDVAEAAYLADRVILLGDRPARITRATAVELERPRTRDSLELVQVIRAIEAPA